MAETYQELLHAASGAYNDYRFKKSALLYEQAYRHAKQFKMLTDSFSAGAKSARAWGLCGYSIRALDLMMQLVQAIPPDVAPSDLFGLKTTWFQILLRINPDAVKLTNHLDELEALANGNPALPQGDAPSLRRMLLYQQGRFNEALEQAELAWAKFNGEGIIKSDHAGAAVSCNLSLLNIKSAKHWHELLIARERDLNQDSIERIECRLLQRLTQVHFALWEQRYEDANAEARELAKQLEGAQYAKWLSTQRES